MSEAGSEAVDFPGGGPDAIRFTGERYTPDVGGAIQREHHHRYLFALDFCRDHRVLDIACGEGYGTHVLAKVAAQVVGVDIAPDAVKAAARRYGGAGAGFAVGNGTSLPFADASFDVVVSFETVEHIEDWAVFLSECARVLTPDGTLLMSSPNREVYSERDGYQNPFHFKEFDRGEFRGALSRHFSSLVLLEQRDLVGSVLIPESVGTGSERKFFESSGGRRYERSIALPSPRYFLAIASRSPLGSVGESLLIDNSPAMPAEAVSSTPALASLGPGHEAALAEIAVRRLEERLAHAERQVVTLRRSNREWAERWQETQGAQEPREPQEPVNLGAAEAEAVEAAAVRPPRKSLAWRLFGPLMRRLRLWHAKQAFDAAFYLRANPDVAEAGIDPFAHYLHTGWMEGRDPSASFSTGYYLRENADVRALGVNPLLHFVEVGRREGRSAVPGEAIAPVVDFVAPQMVPVLLSKEPPPSHRRAELIAFYLPQFHAIPENDEWWGEGFTEWTNVRAAEPQFEGHNQPRVPGELGYYNLLNRDVQRRQIELAKLYGIGGFCFYFYWFSGKRLLEKPVEAWLNDPSLDFPFCLCWANENWTRRWDGNDAHVLISQHYSPEDDLAFIQEVAPYLKDPRYIRVEGKPILIVYRPGLLPEPKKTADRWRAWCRENGVGEIHLAYTQSFERVDPSIFGFDAAIEFPPNISRPSNVTDAVKPMPGKDDLKVFDWRSLLERSKAYDTPSYRLYRGVCPAWDNSPRRRNGGTVFIGSTPELYRTWLSNAISDTERRFDDASSRLVFVNAWNEWAEGAYLEPDLHQGYAFLQATRDAVEMRGTAVSARRSILIVTHDAHPHGAQHLALYLARTFAALGCRVYIVSLGEGPLLEAFAAIGTVDRLDHATPDLALARLKHLHGEGTQIALVNTTVAGALLPLLKRVGFTTVALVHEMPKVLIDRQLGDEARAVADQADLAVFPADLVRQGFEQFCGRSLPQSLVLPQGLIRVNPYRDKREEAHRQVCTRLGLPVHTKIVLSVAFVDHRKGPDLFLDAAEALLARRQDVAFLWIGHFDAGFAERMASEVARRGLKDKVRFLGFIAEPLDYYAAASAYALTSREDPFPNVALESAAVGVPIVAFAGTTGAADFICEHGGRLAEAFDCGEFARHLDELLSRPRSAPIRAVPSIRQYALDLMWHAAGQLRVSVILPNFNYGHFLRDRLTGIIGQSYPIYEIIVLDDASTDDSLAVARAFAAAHPNVDIRIVPNESNSGSVFRQWQKGVALCTGDLVWIAEADDLAESTLVERLVAPLQSKDVVLAYCQSRQIDDRSRVLADDYLGYTDDISDAWRTSYVHEGTQEISDAMAVKNTIPNVSAVLFRRPSLVTAFAEVGDRLFDFRVAGDWLLYLHILKQGKIGFVAEALNSHRRHAGSVTSVLQGRRHYEEVALVQEEAAGLVSVSDGTRRQARTWLAHVAAYLGVAEDRVAS